ncbi:MAG: tRNA 2-thiouridine(34) synthase MnmA [Minisyncoccia bacterium]
MKKHKKVLVAMSGGVDSSVAALLLKKQGYDVIGVFMHSYNIDGCEEKDMEDARRVAGYLNIPFYVFNFEKEYKQKVVDYLINGYKNGITPNPDVMCNKEIKFGLFLNKALSLGADFIATGHYTNLTTYYDKKNNKKIFYLSIARDLNKDQTYFLWTLNQNQLQYCLFPIGKYLKSEVRKIAAQYNLPTAYKKDSQGICFLGKVSIKDFLKNYLPQKKGLVINSSGQKIGEHYGAWYYTIGQRHIGIASKTPVYVVDKDITNNLLVVADENSELLYKNGVVLENVNFVNENDKNKLPLKILTRVRYRQKLIPAILEFKNNNYIVTFDIKQKHVAPGQACVFYQNNNLLGGGFIKNSF